MLLTGINGDLKEAAENSEIMQLLNGKAAKESFIPPGNDGTGIYGSKCRRSDNYQQPGGCHGPQPILMVMQPENSADLRSDIAAESRAKMV